jgi:hypothetical protein
MNFRALVFGTRLIRHGDRAELLLKASRTPPHRDAIGDCEHWRYIETGTTTTFTVRARRIVAIEQRVGDAATA